MFRNADSAAKVAPAVFLCWFESSWAADVCEHLWDVERDPLRPWRRINADDVCCALHSEAACCTCASSEFGPENLARLAAAFWGETVAPGKREESRVSSVDALTPLPSLTESAATGRLYICKGGHHVCIGEQTRSALWAWTCSLTPAHNLPNRLVIKLDWMVTLLLRSELCWGTVGATLLTLVVWRCLHHKGRVWYQSWLHLSTQAQKRFYFDGNTDAH